MPIEQLADGKRRSVGIFAHILVAHILEHFGGLSLTFGCLTSAAGGHSQAGQQRTDPTSGDAVWQTELCVMTPITTSRGKGQTAGVNFVRANKLLSRA